MARDAADRSTDNRGVEGKEESLLWERSRMREGFILSYFIRSIAIRIYERKKNLNSNTRTRVSLS